MLASFAAAVLRLNGMVRAFAVVSAALLAGCGAMSPIRSRYRDVHDPGARSGDHAASSGTSTLPASATRRSVCALRARRDLSVGDDVRHRPAGWIDGVRGSAASTPTWSTSAATAATRPAAMSQPPADNPPFAGADDAVRDISAAVDFILKRRGVPRSVVGWSMGTTFMGSTPRSIPQAWRSWCSTPGMARALAQGPPYSGAYRTGTRESVRGFTPRAFRGAGRADQPERVVRQEVEGESRHRSGALRARRQCCGRRTA